MSKRIALITCHCFDNIIQQLEHDDSDLEQALSKYGHHVETKVWTDTAVDWSAYDLCVLRTTWDYADNPEKCEKFLHWARSVEELGVILTHNSSILRWNCHKGYLLHFRSRGVNTPDMTVLTAGKSFNVATFLEMQPWRQVIVKPAIGNTANGVMRYDRKDAGGRLQSYVEELLMKGDVILQEYIDAVETCGEYSCIFIAGKFSHGVLKRPVKGDYRVQLEFGGDVEAADIPPRVREAAERCLSALPEFRAELVHARFDLVDPGPPHKPILIEAELIDSDLFLEECDGATERLAHGILGVFPPPCYMIVHNVAKKHNIGTLARSCTAFNVAEMCLVGNDRVNVFGSHGADAHVSMKYFPKLAEVTHPL
ncbi:hypothetical protein CYMTET_27999 [Cymbomonas tetramitiformis]|uniref:ATP-grasp domain-containing protein n=1 Tax=Cymbomonas tetramitiformis TaxID=36881 RepID=A0AAE0FNN5_9CHLO|nr:hypothetical protein CYMTET_27999 [Cymbomonas tetramitiformis]